MFDYQISFADEKKLDQKVNKVLRFFISDGSLHLFSSDSSSSLGSLLLSDSASVESVLFKGVQHLG